VLRKLTPLAGIVTFLLAWQIFVVAYGVPAYLLPAPAAIAHAFVGQLPILLSNGWVTVYEMLAGYALAVGIAIPLAIAITSSKRFNEFVMPTMLFFQIVPKVAIAPLFLVWFGFGEFPKMLIAALIAFFPMLIAATVGLKGIDPEMLSMARSMGATPARTFWKVRLPIALPNFFGGFKLAITFSVIGAVIGEFVGGDHGIGYVIQLASGSQRLDLLFAGLIVLSALGLILFYIVEAIERKVCSWHHSQLAATS
jgi:NitT/TauT family transport system permease protein